MTLVAVATPWERRALKGIPRAEILETGQGRRRAKEALKSRNVEAGSLIISAGYVGALHPGMRPGDLVIDVNGGPSETLETVERIAQGLGLERHFGRIATVDAVLRGPSQKKAFARNCRAAAVDMEWDEIKVWAKNRGVRALAFKTVFDGLEDTLPTEFPKNDDLGSALQYIGRRPLALASLFGLYLRNRRAGTHLRDFLDAFLSEKALATK